MQGFDLTIQVYYQCNY